MIESKKGVGTMSEVVVIKEEVDSDTEVVEFKEENDVAWHHSMADESAPGAFENNNPPAPPTDTGKSAPGRDLITPSQRNGSFWDNTGPPPANPVQSALVYSNTDEVTIKVENEDIFESKVAIGNESYGPDAVQTNYHKDVKLGETESIPGKDPFLPSERTDIKLEGKEVESPIPTTTSDAFSSSLAVAIKIENEEILEETAHGKILDPDMDGSLHNESPKITKTIFCGNPIFSPTKNEEDESKFLPERLATGQSNEDSCNYREVAKWGSEDLPNGSTINGEVFIDETIKSEGKLVNHFSEFVKDSVKNERIVVTELETSLHDHCSHGTQTDLSSETIKTEGHETNSDAVGVYVESYPEFESDDDFETKLIPEVLMDCEEFDPSFAKEGPEWAPSYFHEDPYSNMYYPVNDSAEPDSLSHPGYSLDGGIYTCTFCEHRSISEVEWNTHFNREHPQEKPFECMRCSAKFRLRSCLKRHMIRHSDARPFSCTFCPASYKRTETLKAHISEFHSFGSVHSCPRCVAEFQTKYELKEHIRTHSRAEVNQPKLLSAKPVKFVCKFCSVEFKKDFILSKHLKVCLKNPAYRLRQPGYYSCQLCMHKFWSKKDWTDHLVNKHLKEKWRCMLCSADGFMKKFDLDRHLDKHSDVKPLSCPLCSTQFQKKYELRSHLEKAHYKEKRQSCSECSATFKSFKGLQVHSYMHSKSKNIIKPFSCVSCFDVFTAKCALHEHLKVCLKNPTDVENALNQACLCRNCLRRFRSREDLKTHMLTHVQEKTYSCSKCSAKFRTFFALNDHKVIHEDERPYYCFYCSARFKSNQALKNHSNTVHPVGKSVPCQKCSEKFEALTELKEHSYLVHKPFICPYCDFRFTKAFSRRNHMGKCKDNPKNIRERERAKELSNYCSQCPARFRTKVELFEHTKQEHPVEVVKVTDCSDCGMKFPCLRTLRSHERKHKVFSCEHCQLQFKRKMQMVNHLTRCEQNPMRAIKR